jgi:hypothetical protein
MHTSDSLFLDYKALPVGHFISRLIVDCRQYSIGQVYCVQKTLENFDHMKTIS